MKGLLLSIGSVLFCCSSSYGLGAEYVQLVEGKLIFMFQPIGNVGSKGNWQPVILTPDGEYINGPEVNWNDETPTQVTVSCCGGGFVELGGYGIEVKNNIPDSVDADIVSSIKVIPVCPDAPFDTITYKNVSRSSFGENVLLYYVLPSMKEN